jgi:hypothetical protein
MPPGPSVPPDGRRRYVYDVWQALTAFVLLAIFAVTLYLVGTSSQAYSIYGGMICNADGKVKEVSAGYSPLWDIQLFFTINMPVSGHLSYTQAKMIDACWDFAFGRGGQALASIVAYRVLRHSVQLYMEDSWLPIPTVASICCHGGIEPATVWELSRATITRTPRSAKRQKPRIVRVVRYAACVFVCGYVLAFATLASVMTGYIADLEGWFGFKEKGETLLPLQNLTRADYVLLDGNRLNVTKEQYVVMNSTLWEDPLWGVLRECVYRFHGSQS